MFNLEIISRMKWISFLINTSRIGIIDEESLFWVLEQGKLAGAALRFTDGSLCLQIVLFLSSAILGGHHTSPEASRNLYFKKSKMSLKILLD
jgi:hypothetical protein